MLKRRKTQIKTWHALPTFSTRIASAVVSARRALEPWLAAFSLLFTGTTRELYRQFQTGGMGSCHWFLSTTHGPGLRSLKPPQRAPEFPVETLGKTHIFPLGVQTFPRRGRNHLARCKAASPAAGVGWTLKGICARAVYGQPGTRRGSRPSFTLLGVIPCFPSPPGKNETHKSYWFLSSGQLRTTPGRGMHGIDKHSPLARRPPEVGGF